MNAREAIVADAYLRAFGAHPGATDEEKGWGLKTSSEDALNAILRALYPEQWPDDGAAGIYRIREHQSFTNAADRLYELDCDGFNQYEIAKRILPVIDLAMGRTEYD